MKNTKRRLCIMLAAMLTFASSSAPILAEEKSPDELTENSSGEADAKDVSVTQATITNAASWAEIYEALNSVSDDYYIYDDFDNDFEETTDSVSFSETKAASPNDAADYSNTNLREQNVDEADIVKTDGRYLYILQENQYLTIVKADAQQSEIVSKTSLYATEENDLSSLLPKEDNVLSHSPCEMFLCGDRIILILTETRSEENERYSWHNNTFTRILTLDLTDRTDPKLLGNYSQEGFYEQSRRINGVTYLYTSMYPDVGDDLSDSDLSVSVGDQELSPEKFCIPKVITDCSYLVYSSLQDEEPQTPQDAGVFVSGGEQFYVSDSSLYVINSCWGRSKNETQITRFSQTDGLIRGAASCMLNGYVNDTWSIDEYQGNLRVLITYYGIDTTELISNLFHGENFSDSIAYSQGKRKNALLVLDENLQKISRISGIGKNEEIKSARFMGETAYFVTYQNTDPLFRVDLSDPENPVLLDALKIDGFSAYLHPFDTDRLLGIGYDTDPDTGMTLGVKLTMFDTSVPGELKAVQTMVIPGITYCPSIENYKSIFVSPEKGLIGFYYSDRYLLYSYTEDSGFSQKIIYDLLPKGLADTGSSDNMRGLYIDDEFYLAGSSYVIGFSLVGEEDRDFILYT